jgi:hypothetical protein
MKSVFNERTGTPFDDPQCLTDIVLIAVRRRRRFKLSLRDVAEMLRQRGPMLGFGSFESASRFCPAFDVFRPLASATAAMLRSC